MLHVAALACLLGGAPPALAADGGLVLVEHATTDAVSVHGGTKADNVGDVLTFANPMFDAADKLPVGMDQGYCVRLVLGKAFECHITVMLERPGDGGWAVLRHGRFRHGGDRRHGRLPGCARGNAAACA
jgi:hypothetical protein